VVVCNCRTPVRMSLGIWPPLPLSIRHDTWEPDRENENTIAALKSWTEAPVTECVHVARGEGADRRNVSIKEASESPKMPTSRDLPAPQTSS